MKIKALAFLLICGLSAYAQKKFDQPLADSLAKWAIVDQQAANIPMGKFKQLSQPQWDHFKDSVFTAHKKLLNAIFDKDGYPGYDKVGKQGSRDFWLMVQHSDKFSDFQQTVLKAMKVEVDKNNADPKDYAYLVDRVNLNTGKKQVYGTQLTYNTNICQAIPRPLTDSAEVNIRRKSVGLPPIEEYLNMMSQMHFEMNKEGYEKKGITKPVLLNVNKQSI